MSQRVECGRCRTLFYSILRECPTCGAENEACTSKYEKLEIEIDQSVLVAARAAGPARAISDVITEALEEWISRQGKK